MQLSFLEKQTPLVTRFAPSPTGYLHLGHVASLIFVFGFAELLNARVLLRIEDHDRERCLPKYEQAILDDIAWLGLFPSNWEAISQNKRSSFRQSDNLALYDEALSRLSLHTYGCDCSRKQLGQTVEGQEPVYPGICQNKTTVTDPHGIRFRVHEKSASFHDLMLGFQTQTPAQQCGDFLLKDRRGFFSYNCAVVVDDMRHGVNLIIRGQDILECTGRQLLLAKALGETKTPLYLHHSLLYDEHGKKLSKRFFSEGIILRREQGEHPGQVIGEALYLAQIIKKTMRIKPKEIAPLLQDCYPHVSNS